MLLGIYADPHITKNMRSLQDLWDTTAKKSIVSMYDRFDEMGVEMVVCLGDFFDAPRLEAKHMGLILPILDSIDQRTYPTYILLGNHEIDSDETNILEFIKNYENIHPVTDLYEMEDMLFIPYNIDPRGIDMKDKVVFTHHDIYGSELAGGKTKAFFGIDPTIFSEAKIVWNGHVHLKSQVSSNVMNAGSLMTSQQGELKLGTYPSYYIMDKKEFCIQELPNEYSMMYLTIDSSEVGEVAKHYDPLHCVLRVEYEGTPPEEFIQTAHTSWKKKLSSIEDREINEIHQTSFDMINYLTDYIKKDPSVAEDMKQSYINTSKELLL